MFRGIIRTVAYFVVCCLLVDISNNTLAEQQAWEISVTSEHAAQNIPVKVQLDESLAGNIVLTGADGSHIPAQPTKPGLLDAGEKAATELHFVLPSIDAGKTVKLTATKADSKAGTSFTWHDTSGLCADLKYGDRSVLRYMYEAPDRSSKERLGETYKIYHHVYDPTGEKLLTKGPGGLFPHHRGLFFGFNRISYGDGKRADTWHCRNNETQEHVEVLQSSTGPVLGRHRVAINWHGQDKEVFAREERELTVYNVVGGTLIEFASRLTSLVGPVKLDGDPQHAGFQFRATQHVPDKTKNQTYYIRPDGKGEPGKFRNWPDDADHVNLPWNALCFVVDGQRYTCCYLDRPENPKESRFSERDYGRFGSYFEYELDDGRDLQLNYRIWIQEGQMTVPSVAAQSQNFVEPPIAVANRK